VDKVRAYQIQHDFTQQHVLQHANCSFLRLYFLSITSSGFAFEAAQPLCAHFFERLEEIRVCGRGIFFLCVQDIRLEVESGLKSGSTVDGVGRMWGVPV
jgi:hypothetical protein